MIKPKTLQKADKVAIVCTARKFSKDNAQMAVDLLLSWGLEPVLGSTIDLDNFQLAGTDIQRASDFNKQLADPEIKAIWCARGGYGTVRIIDLIDFDLLLKNPKWIIGFSDVTVLHSHINTLGMQSIHGIMAFSVPSTDPESVLSLKQTIFGQKLCYRIACHPNNILGQSTGELVGGNLSIIYSLLGSKSSLSTSGKILFLEDLDEYLYHVDRMMYNLDRNGLLKNLKGLVIGGMTQMKDNEIPFGQNAQEIILSIVKKYDFPVVFDFPSGHLSKNLTLKLGEQVTLNVHNSGVELEYLT
ncbi:S66 peptidase family protein [Myroides sp. LJL119]